MKLLLRIYRRLVLGAASILPLADVDLTVRELVRRGAKKLSPKERLRFLFGLDEYLYGLQGVAAIEYGGGLHPKHRQMGHIEFFVSRVKGAKRVLDIGCGVGIVADGVVGQTGAEVLGVDLSEKNIKAAKDRFSRPGLEFRRGDALKDLPQERFDTVILSNVLEHLPERPAFLRRVVRTIGPEKILIRVPLFDREWRVPLKKELGVEWRLDPTHETEYTVQSFMREMDQAGLEIKSLETRWGEIWAEVAP